MVCGCSKNPDEQLVGKWRETANPLGMLVFNSDHTGRAYWPDNNGKQVSEEMKWVVLKGENRVSVITAPGPVNFDIKTDQLVSPNGVILVKVK
jgi:hypothetical protein